MKAIVHSGQSGLAGLQYTESISRVPATGEVRIQLQSAGINHRDLFIMAGRTSQEAPLIPGSDGAGIIVEIGEGVRGFAIGDEVIIHPTLGWEVASNVPIVPDIVGGPTDGTLAQYITLPAENALPKPAHLSWEEAGVLSLSALTAYRALFTRGELKQGEHILIPGIGGGVATYALLMAVAAGAKVTVTSRSEAKRNEALRLGATHALDSHADWCMKNDMEPVDIILDSIGQAMFPKYFDIIRPGGRIVMYGASSGDDLTVPIRSIFFPQISLNGTSMGSREEFIQMLQWVEQHDIHPVIDGVYPLQDVAKAFERMEKGEQFGNLAILME
ncbi:zinc-binding alcohol dehydrogenase/oxidoreductase [Paenibacillus sp. W4I10]|uniref:quinone oxidoreductase family protein n=1 Tax=Paenibacillus sp. W4I10 TaxID=3042298 RepID=UPI002783294C|nr:zinc-binding dehydrogenase [Paenibacillus sp. W4I10]MDQ0722595.1 zinc-binding alcohol dehydrogenase/oxidoreductase [Paenibacillus sp. W4I10]